MDPASQSVDCGNCPVDEKCLNRLVPGVPEFAQLDKVLVTYQKGEILCKVGEYPTGVRTVLDGFVKIFVEDPNHRHIIVKILAPGDFLGLASICGCVTYSYTATALNECLVCSMEREAVRDLMEKSGKFAFEIAKWYCRNYDRAYAKISSLGFKRLPGRMADVLFYLDQSRFREHGIYRHLTRKELADMAGITMESAVRILSDMDKSGIIHVSGREIAILDFKRLEQISRAG